MLTAIKKHQDPYEFIEEQKARLVSMEAQLSTHIKWFTHKNPYGCVICETIQMNWNILDSFEEFLGPNPQQTLETVGQESTDSGSGPSA